MASTPILAACDVSKVFPIGRSQELLAVDRFSLDIEEGELICLLGASGCGGTTPFLFSMSWHRRSLDMAVPSSGDGCRGHGLRKRVVPELVRPWLSLQRG